MADLTISESFGTLDVYFNTCATATDGEIHVVDYLFFAGPYTYSNILWWISDDGGTTWTGGLPKPNASDLIFGGLKNGTYLIKATGDTYTNSGRDYVGPFLYTFAPILLDAGVCPIVFGISSIMPTCSTATNGSITVGPPTGGTAPYTYWISRNSGPFVQGGSNIFNNLDNAIYQIRVIDVNGLYTDSLYVWLINLILCAQTPNYTITTTTTPPTCNTALDGVINVILTGTVLGTGPWKYEVSINGGAYQLCGSSMFGLGNGTYQFRVTDMGSGYVATSAVIIFAAGVCALDATLSVTPAVCRAIADGIITILGPTGGVPPYTITYTDNGGPDIPVVGNVISGLAWGHTYIVKIVDSAATTIFRNVVMTAAAVNCTPFSATITPINPTCIDSKDGYFVIKINSGYPPFAAAYTFNGGGAISCNNIVTKLGIGTYEVTLTDKYGRNLVWEFVLSAPACPQITQRDMLWSKLLCCAAAMWDQWLTKSKIGDTDAACLKKRALMLQMIIEIIQYNSAEAPVENCLTGEELEALFQLALVICDECECSDDSALVQIMKNGFVQIGTGGLIIRGPQ